ncbi:phenylalanyl-tRNA synthetase [Ramicandelaber brevisporus]|nr:phenylalanyl-tRNA synthetase [Ramicandelaber brevisporus]
MISIRVVARSASSSSTSGTSSRSSIGRRALWQAAVCIPTASWKWCSVRRAHDQTQAQAQAQAQSAVTEDTEQDQPLRIGTASYERDEWTNIPPGIAAKLCRGLHRDKSHPLGILSTTLFSHFKDFTKYTDLAPVVTTHASFDSLLIPPDHPSRRRTDTYYVNSELVLRPQTSAHQLQILQGTLPTPAAAGETPKAPRFLVAADVYRRDEIDASHYPAFHQLEGVCTFKTATVIENVDREIAASASEVTAVKGNLRVKTLDDTAPSDNNPVQGCHTDNNSAAVARHMKHMMNGMVQTLFSKIAAATDDADTAQLAQNGELPVRWVDAYFPFTSPSWEMEVMYRGEWLELCGCGVMRQEIMNNASLPDHMGWAFGFGLERLAMVLFGIPDIRLFWSSDPRFRAQFSDGMIRQFQPFSTYNPCNKDISFWLPSDDPEVQALFHDNDFAELVRETAGDLVEDVKLIDKFTHPKTKRASLCYRIVYRSMDRILTNAEINVIHNDLRLALVSKLGVELR